MNFIKIKSSDPDLYKDLYSMPLAASGTLIFIKITCDTKLSLGAARGQGHGSEGARSVLL